MILQWNINGFFSQLEQLQILISEKPPEIICLQETNFSTNKVGQIKNYNSVHKNRERLSASGGVAIYVKTSLAYHHIDLNTNLEAVAITVETPANLSICNIYVPNNYKVTLAELEALLTQLPSPFILVGDMNSHNQIWGSVRTDSRGRIFEQLLTLHHNLVLLNSTSPTRFDASTGSFSAIDLAFCSAQLASSLEWEPLQSLYGSDHFPIKISNCISEPTVIPHQRWNLRSADWDMFATLMEGKIATLPAPQDFSRYTIDEILTHFVAAINSAALRAVGHTHNHNRRKSVPWWNAECQEAVKAYKKAFNQFRKHPTEPKLTLFRRLRAKARNILKNNKRKAWTSFVSTMTAQTPSKEIWNKIRRINGINKSNIISGVLNSNNIIESDNKIIADILAQTFRNNSSDYNYTAEFLRTRTTTRSTALNNQHSLPINALIRKDELLYALKQTKNSSPGPDGIPNTFLKNLGNQAVSYLLALYNLIWTQNCFPHQWRLAITVPIAKPNKDKTKPENYRPISLTCTLCKLLEKIVNRRLQWYLENIDFLYNRQSGFRRFRSTLDTLLGIETAIQEALKINHVATLVSLDIKKAYEMVWRPRILNILWENGVQGRMFQFLDNFLRKRYLQVRVNGILSSAVEQQNGVPQGSVLSVTLFLVAINDIVKTVKPPTTAFLFADDLTLHCSGRTTEVVQKMLQHSLIRLQAWTSQTGFTFSEEKTQTVSFTRKRLRSPVPPLTLNDIAIQNTTSIKILGLIMDQKLNWKTHLRSLKTSCVKRLNMLKVIASQAWGADTSVLLQAYRALIRSKIDYGAVVYASASHSTLNTLDAIHHHGLRLATGAFRTSPVQSLLSEAGELPLNLRRMKQTLRYYIKLQATPNHPMRQVLSQINGHLTSHRQLPFHDRVLTYLDKLNLDLPTELLPHYHNDIPPWTLPQIKIDTSLSKLPKSTTPQTLYLQTFREHYHKHSDHIKIFTDGSKQGNNVGCSIISSSGESASYRLHPINTIYTAELYAIQQAFNFALHSPTHMKFLVYTDSLSSVNALQDTWTPHKLIQNIHQTHNALAGMSKVVKLIWIPSHMGIGKNEEADKLAKAASTDTSLQVSQVHTWTDITTHMDSQVMLHWNKHWTDTINNKLRSIKHTNTKFSPPSSLSRRDTTVLTRLRIGHTRLTHSYHFLHLHPPTCSHCDNTPLTVQHILLHCHKYKQTRDRLNTLRTLQDLTDATHYTKILDFLKTTKLYTDI